MITAYRPRDVRLPTGDERTLSEREANHVAWAFERTRSLMIESTAREFGLQPVRRMESHRESHRESPRERPSERLADARTDETELLEVSVEIDFENNFDPDVSNLEDRFTTFLHALEDRDIAHLLFEVDRDDERAFLENFSLAFLTIHHRDSTDRAPRPRRHTTHTKTGGPTHMAALHQNIDLAPHDPEELFEELRAAAAAEEIASRQGLHVSKHFIGQDRATLALVFSGDARTIAEAHEEISTQAKLPHIPYLAVANSQEELRVLRNLGPALEIDFENPSHSAVLTLTYTGPESPRDMATGYARCANLIDEARRRGLEADHEHDDQSLHVTVRGPRDDLDKLAAFAERVLNRTVDVEDDD